MYLQYSNNYDIWASCYDLKNKEIQKLRSIIDFSNKSVLDIGCGTGRLTFRLLPYVKRIVGIDNDAHSIDISIKKLNNYDGFKNGSCDYLCQDAVELKVHEKFDIVIFSWSLYQIGNMEKAIKNAKNVLNDDGLLMILQPFSGDYESIFSIKSKNMSIDDFNNLYKAEVNYCLDNFKELSVSEFTSSFVFKDENDAISLNDFFYIISLNMSIKDDKKLHENIKKQLKKHRKAEMIFLSDTTKIICASNKIT